MSAKWANSSMQTPKFSKMKCSAQKCMFHVSQLTHGAVYANDKMKYGKSFCMQKSQKSYSYNNQIHSLNVTCGYIKTQGRSDYKNTTLHSVHCMRYIWCKRWLQFGSIPVFCCLVVITTDFLSLSTDINNNSWDKTHDLLNIRTVLLTIKSLGWLRCGVCYNSSYVTQWTVISHLRGSHMEFTSRLGWPTSSSIVLMNFNSLSFLMTVFSSLTMISVLFQCSVRSSSLKCYTISDWDISPISVLYLWSVSLVRSDLFVSPIYFFPQVQLMLYMQFFVSCTSDNGQCPT